MGFHLFLCVHTSRSEVGLGRAEAVPLRSLNPCGPYRTHYPRINRKISLHATSSDTFSGYAFCDVSES
jgi:hypothetical protein